MLSGALVVASVTLTACATTTTICVSWASYPTDQDAYDAAALVVVGVPGDVVSTRTVLGTDVPVREFTVEETLKGTAPAGLTVAQTPVTCSPDPGPDPLATDDRVVLFLIRQEGAHRPLTPDVGVLELPAGEPLPFDTAAG